MSTCPTKLPNIAKTLSLIPKSNGSSHFALVLARQNSKQPISKQSTLTASSALGTVGMYAYFRRVSRAGLISKH
eukprot:4457959-Pleurochrysis_carterae.AAC.2